MSSVNSTQLDPANSSSLSSPPAPKRTIALNQRVVVGFFMWVALALLWIGNGVLMDPLWQVTKVGDQYIMALRKETQVGMIKTMSLVYWIFLVLVMVMASLSIDKKHKAPGNLLSGIFYFCLGALSLVGMVGAGFLTSKVWKATPDPTNPHQVLLRFNRGQLVCVRIMCVIIWADIVFAALLAVRKDHFS